MALLLRRNNSFRNPSLIHLFSTSSSHSNSNSKSNEDEPESSASDDRVSSKPDSSFASYISDIKKKLNSHQSSSSSSTFRSPSTPSFTACGSVPRRSPSVSDSLEEIRKNLSSFRSRYSESNSTTSSSSSAPSSNTTSFQEIYERNVTGKRGVSPSIDDSASGRLGTDLIRQTLLNSKPNNVSLGGAGKEKILNVTKSLRMKLADSQTSSTVIGGTGELPEFIFGREKRQKEEGKISEEGKLLFVKTYKPEELGNKLRKLRPETKGKDWFSLSELNDRLMKLREMEEKANEGSVKGITAKDLRDVLTKIKVDDAGKKNNFSDNILGQLGRKPSFMLKPPQEHLVEKYFHPDNMSSEEKLKIELAKVRDEFKMSESDCGSSRVQVAQLTTKIKHLSSVLHKKDKHSRKGLLAMVQKRKRLLKYLRRTDWDSYCFVISKLGLRDNPDTKY